MKRTLPLTAMALALFACASIPGIHADEHEEDGWVSLFNGENLDGWKASENEDTFSVEDGVIVVDGPRAHLFYEGPVEDHDFKNFELKAQVKTEPQANSGIYFHTEYQEEGWPSKGYESQVNNTHSDWRKTGSLYAIEDVRDSPAEDGEWFDYHIRVDGDRIVLKVNGETMVDYTEPDDVEREEGMEDRLLDRGTIALQGHDPESVIYYRDIQIKPLED